MATKAHLEGNKRYLQKFDDIKIRVPAGERGVLKDHVHQLGYASFNAFVIDAIHEKIDREKK